MKLHEQATVARPVHFSVCVTEIKVHDIRHVSHQSHNGIIKLVDLLPLLSQMKNERDRAIPCTLTFTYETPKPKTEKVWSRFLIMKGVDKMDD